MRSVMQHAFSQIPNAEIPRSSFDRSSGLKTTLDAGYLVPVFLDEALPGDTFNLQTHAFGRLATPQFPVMDNMFMDFFYFAVPLRLLWDNWERFNGAQDDPDDSTDFTIPVIDPDAVLTTGSLADYLGLPVGVTVDDTDEISALPFRAYNLIYNEWFRDQNLQPSLSGLAAASGEGRIPTGNGPDDLNNSGSGALLRRGKRHDYFTSCLPWPQKGDSVTMPLGTSAPVIPDPVLGSASTSPFWVGLGANPTVLGGTAGVSFTLTSAIASATSQLVRISGAPGDLNTSGMVADLTEASAATINQLRQAFQVQRLLERDARGGTRYTEILRAHFGVTSPDARLQRPEYLGGGSTPINITSVPQTSGTETEGVVGTPQGNLAGFGTVSVHGNGFTKSFTEHCIIIGLCSVRADLTYQQGLDRMWSRQTRFDFYWPALSHIGEQAVLNKEIFFAGNPATSPGGDNDVFGYQERYAEYRYKPSRLTGLMRSNPTTGTSLDPWHLSIDFAGLPTLSDVFIQDDPPIDRVIAVPGEPHFILDCYFALRCARPMPMYGVPGMIDHF